MKITQETTQTTTPQIESRTTTRDEVLAMVEQTCGSTKISAGNIYYTFTAGQLERFAALVAAAEREECANDKVDAERYRWLCEHANLSLGGVRGNCIIVLDRYALMKTKSVELDEAIDRARSAK